MKLKCLLFIIISIFFALFLFSSCSGIGDVEDMGIGETGGNDGGVGSKSVSISSMTDNDSSINRNNNRDVADTISVLE